MKKIVFGNDHSAVQLKKELIPFIEEKGYEVINVGTDEEKAVDYPVIGEMVANMVASGNADLGIAVCGTGLGISLACNKVNGIRACVCSDAYTARYSRLHNNCNILCFGARVVGPETAKLLIEEFLNAQRAYLNAQIDRLKEGCLSPDALEVSSLLLEGYDNRMQKEIIHARIDDLLIADIYPIHAHDDNAYNASRNLLDLLNKDAPEKLDALWNSLQDMEMDAAARNRCRQIMELTSTG